jgi:hypothetical protein
VREQPDLSAGSARTRTPAEARSSAHPPPHPPTRDEQRGGRLQQPHPLRTAARHGLTSPRPAPTRVPARGPPRRPQTGTASGRPSKTGGRIRHTSSWKRSKALTTRAAGACRSACGGRVGEVVLVALPFGAGVDVVRGLRAALGGKVLVDCSNPVGPGFRLLAEGGHSAASRPPTVTWCPARTQWVASASAMLPVPRTRFSSRGPSPCLLRPFTPPLEGPFGHHSVRGDRRLPRRLPHPHRFRPALQHLARRGAPGTARRPQAPARTAAACGGCRGPRFQAASSPEMKKPRPRRVGGGTRWSAGQALHLHFPAGSGASFLRRPTHGRQPP